MSGMNFGEPSGGGFIDTHFDFSRCQRPDGSYYGTSGQCRKGTPVSAKEKAELQARASRGDKAAMKKLTDLRAEGKIGKEAGFAPGSKAREAAKETKEKIGGGSKGSSKADISAKAKEVRAMDKEAKAANKAADAAEKKWRKGGMKDKELQKEVRRLDKEAKAKDKEADRAARELARMRKSAESAKGREKNVKLNQALAQDGPKPTGKQRAQAVRVLTAEQRRLQNMEDDGGLSKAGAARLKLVNASLRSYGAS